MKIRTLVVASLLAIAIISQAKPAKRVARLVQQPDGTYVTLTLVGDEYHSYFITEDQQMVLKKGDAYYFATINEAGTLIPSEILAANPDDRSALQSEFIDRIDKNEMIEAVQVTREANPRLKTMLKSREESIANKAPSRSSDRPWEGIGRFPNWNFATKGSPKGIAILVEYQDVKFSQSDEETWDYFNRLLSEEGFSDLGATGSALDYFIDQSNGVFTPEFVLLGPVTLPNDRAYYGANNGEYGDQRPGEMVRDAVDILYEQGVDFSQFVAEGDKSIGNTFIFYAGVGEAETGLEEAIWPHSYELRYYDWANWLYGYKVGSTYINSYACSAEICDSKGTLDGIGSFVHEFSHVIGLPDLYNTSDGNATYTPGAYTVMDQGTYNNNGRTPPAYSAFERNACGWIDLTEITGPMNLTIEDIKDSNKAYVIRTDSDNEFYLFENRQQKGWDLKIPYHGMLVWHIDYNKTRWKNNTVNEKESHQYVDLVEAAKSTWVSGATRTPFPGSKKVRSFTDDTDPAMVSWSGKGLGLPMTEIYEEVLTDNEGNEILDENGNTTNAITLKVAGGQAGISDALVGSDIKIEVNGRQVSVDGDTSAVIIDMWGRIVARGEGVHLLKESGIYMVRCKCRSIKIAVR